MRKAKNYNKSCMFCGQVIQLPRATGGVYEIRCVICGRYRVTAGLLEDGPAVGKEGYLLSAWIHWQNLERAKEVPTFTPDRIKELLNDLPRYRPSEKADRLLVGLGRLSERPGVVIEDWAHRLVPLSWARDEDEADAYLSWLFESELIQEHGDEAGYSLLEKGWERFEKLMTTGRATSRRAFVAMWFDDSMDQIWEQALKPAIEEAGFEPYRVKSQAQSDRIDAHIIAEIRACRFVVADVTGTRTAVYYEAGFAEGLGKHVIWTCDAKKKDDMSFDTRQFPHMY